MKNVTEIFKKVVTSDINWTVSKFYLVIETLKNDKFNLSFWEGEENWASIYINNKVLGYVWKKHPLIVIEKEIAFQIKDSLEEIKGVYFIEVDSLSNDLFKIEDEELKQYFENFNRLNQFTIDDLWFYTNSI